MGVLLIGAFLMIGLAAQEDGSSSSPETSSSTSTDGNDEGTPQPSKSYQQRIEKLLEALKSDDPETADRAKKELFQIGRRAIPAIRKKLKESEGGVYYQLLQQMKSLFSKPVEFSAKPKSDREILDWLSVEEELHSIERWTKEADTPVNEKLLVDRYRDALKRYRAGEPRKALQIAKALMIVAPELSFKDKVKKFIRKCRQRIFNESRLRADITTGKVRYGWGEDIMVTFHVKNVSNENVKIYFDRPTSQEKNGQTQSGERSKNGETADGDSDESSQPGAEGSQDRPEAIREVQVADKASSSKKIVLELEQEKIGLNGDRVTETHYREFPVPARITIPPGETWRKKVELPISGLKHRYVLRRMTLGARVLPSLLKFEKKQMNRWIFFKNASFELYPRGMRESLPASLEKIKRHLQSGNLRDVFFLTFLLGEGDHEELVRYFLKVLPFLKRGPARTIMFLLQELTGKSFYFSREQWLKWGREEYDIDVNPPEDDQNSNPVPNFVK